MPHDVTPPAFAIGLGILLIASGLFSLRFWGGWSRPIIGRLLLIVSGLFILFAIGPLQNIIKSGTDQLPNILYGILGPTGVVIAGVIVVALLVGILLYRRTDSTRGIPFGVQRRPPIRRGVPKKLLDLFVEEAVLIPVDAVEGDLVGVSVAISNNTAVALSRENRAYVFVRQERTLDSWSQQAELVTGGESAKVISPHVAISDNRVVIGTKVKDGTNTVASVFVRKGTTWQEEGELTADPGTEMKTLAISGDTIAVGTYDSVKKASTIHIFIWDGRNWGQQTRLESAGNTIALQGNTLVVGAKGAEAGIGVVEVFVRQGNIWQKQAHLHPNDKARGSGFGSAIAISGDTIICGAPDHFRTIGAVYVFVRTGTQWKQQALLVPADHLPGTCGYSVAIYGDTIAAGAPLKNGASGIVHLFVRQGEQWVENKPLTSTNRAQQDHFGHSIDINENTIIVGIRPVSQYAVINAGGSVVATMQGDANFALGKMPGLVPAPNNSRSRGFAVVFARHSH